MNLLRNIHLARWTTALILTACTLASCQLPVQASRVGAGQVVVHIAAPSRTVVADWAAQAASYSISLSGNGSYASHTASTNTTLATLTNIELGTWNVSVTALNASGNAIAAYSGQTAVQSGSGTSITATLTSSQTGTGAYSLTVSVPASTGVDTLTTQLYNATDTAVGTASTVTLTGTTNLVGTSTQTGVASGAYRLQLTLRRGGAGGPVAGIFSEAVNVWDNTTSDQWLDSAGVFQTQRTFTEGEFASSKAALANLTVAQGSSSLLSLPSTTLLGTTSTADTSTAFVITPTAAVAGQVIEYQLNNTGTWIAASSAAPFAVTPSLPMTLTVRVTAPDGATTKRYSVGITNSGTIAALAAVATPTPLGSVVANPCGITALGGLLYYTSPQQNKIFRCNIDRTVETLLAGNGTRMELDGVGSSASFYSPFSICNDGTNLYVVDQGGALRKIVVSTGVVSTLATMGDPEGVATDGTSVYVSQMYGHNILKVDLATGTTTVFAGWSTAAHADGRGTAAAFNGPGGMATDGTNLYVAEWSGNVIRKIVLSTGDVTTIAGQYGIGGNTDSSTGTSATFSMPFGLATDGTNLYVADSGNNCIRMVSLTPPYAVSTFAATGLLGPRQLASDGTFLYITDTLNNKIVRLP